MDFGRTGQWPLVSSASVVLYGQCTYSIQYPQQGLLSVSHSRASPTRRPPCTELSAAVPSGGCQDEDERMERVLSGERGRSYWTHQLSIPMAVRRVFSLPHSFRPPSCNLELSPVVRTNLRDNPHPPLQPHLLKRVKCAMRVFCCLGARVSCKILRPSNPSVIR